MDGGGSEKEGAPMRNQADIDEKDYLTDAFSREAVDFVTRHKGKRFFLYLAYNAVHGPFQAPPEYLDRFRAVPDPQRRACAAMLSAMDDGIGRLLGRLRDLRLEENTLVFFLSDNGGPPPDRSPASNAPLRGHKGTLFEGGVRVPFVVQWKGRLKAGTTCDAPISSLDLFPTAAAAGEASVPEALKLDGADILPFLTGRTSTPPHERLYWRSSRMKTWAMRDGRWKLVHIGDGKDSLFDLSADIGEKNDLASTRPDVVERLAQVYAEWDKSNVPPLWGPPSTPGRR